MFLTPEFNTNKPNSLFGPHTVSEHSPDIFVYFMYKKMAETTSV